MREDIPVQKNYGILSYSTRRQQEKPLINDQHSIIEFCQEGVLPLINVQKPHLATIF